MSRYIPLAFMIALLAGCSLGQAPAQHLVSSPRVSGLPVIQLTVGNVPLTVEVAKTEAERSRGLSGRASLPEDRGMLFLFPRPDKYSFWMNHMNFPLDFIWLRDGKVVEITANMPAPTPEKPNPVTLRPNQAIDAVIEVNAGWVAQHQVQVGQRVEGLTGQGP